MAAIELAQLQSSIAFQQQVLQQQQVQQQQGENGETLPHQPLVIPVPIMSNRRLIAPRPIVPMVPHLPSSLPAPLPSSSLASSSEGASTGPKIMSKRKRTDEDDISEEGGSRVRVTQDAGEQEEEVVQEPIQPQLPTYTTNTEENIEKEAEVEVEV